MKNNNCRGGGGTQSLIVGGGVAKTLVNLDGKFFNLKEFHFIIIVNMHIYLTLMSASKLKTFCNCAACPYASRVFSG